MNMIVCLFLLILNECFCLFQMCSHANLKLRHNCSLYLDKRILKYYILLDHGSEETYFCFLTKIIREIILINFQIVPLPYSEWAFSRLLTDGEDAGLNTSTLPKIYYIHLSMMKLDSVIPHLKNSIKCIYHLKKNFRSAGYNII